MLIKGQHVWTRFPGPQTCFHLRNFLGTGRVRSDTAGYCVAVQLSYTFGRRELRSFPLVLLSACSCCADVLEVPPAESDGGASYWVVCTPIEFCLLTGHLKMAQVVVLT